MAEMGENRLKIKKGFALLVVLAYMLAPAARAAGGMPEGWVNFRPAEWDRGDAVCALSRELAAQADTREALPRLVHDWICDNIYYDEDALEAGIYAELSASETLHARKGVCESFANLAQSLLLEAGVPCVKVWGAAIPEGERWSETGIDPERVNHTWNEYYLDGHWHPMDCTMDMGNRFRAGAFLPGEWGSAYLDPEPEFFAETHRCLQRSFDLPEDLPDGWAVPELEQAAQRGSVPLAYFGRYREAVTERELCEMLGADGGNDEPLSRASAAVLLAERLGTGTHGGDAFADTRFCGEEERQAVAALARRGITAGTGNGQFSPRAIITRQEAIVLIERLYREGYSCI